MNQFFSLVKSYFPSPLPTGMNAFEVWAKDIIVLVGPLADENSIKFALASQIMHLNPTNSSVSKQYFVRCLKKSAANQIASQVFQTVKQAQKEAEEIAKLKLAEDTAKEAVLDVTKVL